jgi:hypothetical protein
MLTRLFPAQVTTMVVKLLMVFLVTNFTIVAAIASFEGITEFEDWTYDRPIFVVSTAVIAAIIMAVYQGLLDLTCIFNSPFGPGLLQVSTHFLCMNATPLLDPFPQALPCRGVFRWTTKASCTRDSRKPSTSCCAIPRLQRTPTAPRVPHIPI